MHVPRPPHYRPLGDRNASRALIGDARCHGDGTASSFALIGTFALFLRLSEDEGGRGFVSVADSDVISRTQVFISVCTPQLSSVVQH